MTLQYKLDVYEKNIIEAYLKHYGKVSKVHKALGIDRKTLYRKMVKHGIIRKGRNVSQGKEKQLLN